METYTISGDFSGNTPNLEQLENEISANSNILKNVLYSTTSETDDTADIIFDAVLSAGEKTELDGVVAAHVPLNIPETPNSLNITVRSNNIKTSSYKRMAANIFPGTTYATAKCVSYMKSSSTSYSVKIFDKDNKQVLAEGTFTNTTESAQDLGVLSNLSSDPTQIEISAKVTGGGKAYLESVIICYN